MINIFKFIFLASSTLPRDYQLSRDYVVTEATIRYWKLRGWSIPDLFDQVVATNPQKTAIRLDETAWTYKMLSDYSLQVANYFRQKGLQKGDVVALFMENQPRYVGIWLGLSRLGVVTALINTQQKMESLQHAITIAASKAVICGTELLQEMVDLQNSQWKLPDNIVLYTSGERNPTDGLDKSWNNLDLILDGFSTKPLDKSITKQIGLSTRMLFIYTSGTTGLPKAAIMTQNRFVFLAVAVQKTLQFKQDDVIYTPMPLYHAAGGLVGSGQMILFGNTMVTKVKFSARAYIPDCRKYGVTVGQYIGEMCSYLMAREPSKGDKDHSIRLMVGNGMRSELWEKFRDRFGVKQIGEFYGSTEGNANMINSANYPGAVGFMPWFAAPIYSLELIQYDTDTGDPKRDEKTGLCIPVADGEPGLLVGRIKVDSTSSAFQGYVDQKATEKKIINDVLKKGDMYFNSGDVLRRDEYGYFYFMDRLGDTYRWKGENIAASQVEITVVRELKLQPNDVAVYGVVVPGNPGRAGMVTINTHGESEIDLAALRDAGINHMNELSMPQFVRISKNDLPRTSTQKIMKAKLQQQGYDPAVVNKDKSPEEADALYVYNKGQKSYVPITDEVMKQITEEKWRF